MAQDDGSMAGLFGEGQRTIEYAGGAGERAETIRHARDMVVRRFIEVAFFVLWVPLIAGPWCLVWYIPWLFDRALLKSGEWLDLVQERTTSEELTYRLSLACIGVGVGVLLLVLDDSLLFWWPWRWQATRESLRGLLWPCWWWQSIPSVFLIRLALIVGPIHAAPAIKHLDQRQLQEIRAPTLSGAAHATVDPWLVQLDGWKNPYRDPQVAPEPPRVIRTMFRLLPEDGGDGHGMTRIVDCSSEIATLDQLAAFADLTLNEGVAPTRGQMVTKQHLWTDPGWRVFQGWAKAQHLMEQAGGSTTAPYTLTPAGCQWLRTVLEGDED
jgi:hypothetical protein